MKQNKRVNLYSRMFLNTVGIENAPSAINELNTVNRLMTKSRDFRGFLVGPQFLSVEKENVLKKIASIMGLSDTVVKFIACLSELRVISTLPEIIKMSTKLYLEKKRMATALVLSPIELSKDCSDRINASLKRLTERDIDISVVIDPSLLGGILIKVGSTMYDSSVKGQLRLLKDELLKG